MRIFSPLKHEREFCAPAGNCVRDEFTLAKDGRGAPALVKSGEVDLKEFINSFRDDCLIENIVRRYQNGDINALNRVQGFYGDVTNLPNDIHEADKVLLYAKEIFENLGEDLRKDYPDFNAFINAFASPESVDKFVRGFAPAAQGIENVDNGGNVNELS